jgi:hypothetical protein
MSDDSDDELSGGQEEASPPPPNQTNYNNNTNYLKVIIIIIISHTVKLMEYDKIYHVSSSVINESIAIGFWTMSTTNSLSSNSLINLSS